MGALSPPASSWPRATPCGARGLCTASTSLPAPSIHGWHAPSRIHHRISCRTVRSTWLSRPTRATRRMLGSWLEWLGLHHGRGHTPLSHPPPRSPSIGTVWPVLRRIRSCGKTPEGGTCWYTACVHRACLRAWSGHSLCSAPTIRRLAFWTIPCSFSTACAKILVSVCLERQVVSKAQKEALE